MSYYINISRITKDKLICIDGFLTPIYRTIYKDLSGEEIYVMPDGFLDFLSTLSYEAQQVYINIFPGKQITINYFSENQLIEII